MTFTMSAAQAAILNPEFWKLLLVGASIVMSPDFGEWLLSKYPPATVYLFAACLPAIPIGTYLAGVGLVHLLYTPLLVLASWMMCVAIMDAIAALYKVCRAVASGVSSVGRALHRTVTHEIEDVRLGFVELAELMGEYRKCTAAAVVAASLVSPPFASLAVVGLVLWAIYQVVQALVCFAQCVDALARAAGAAATEAVDRAVRAVEAAISAAADAVVSAFWSVLSFRKCIAALVVAVSFAYPAFGEWVVLGLVLWAIYGAILAVAYLVECVDALARAAGAAADEAADRAVLAVVAGVSAAADAVVSAFWSILSFRKCMAALVVAAGLAYPAFGELVVVVLALSVIYGAMLAVGFLIVCLVDLACAVVEAVKEAATRAIRAVVAVVAAAIDAVVSAFWSILAFRKCMVALVVAASVVVPPFGALVVVGLTLWVFVQAVLALVRFFECVIDLVCAAVVAAEAAAEAAVDRAVRSVGAAMSAAVDVVLSAAWSVGDALFRVALVVEDLLESALLWALSLLALILQAAAITDVVEHPCPATVATALVITAGFSLVKYAVKA